MRVGHSSASLYENTAHATQRFALAAMRRLQAGDDVAASATAEVSSDVSISQAGRRVYEMIAMSPTLRNLVPNFYPNATDHNSQLAGIAARQIVEQARSEGISLNLSSVENAIRDQFGIGDQRADLYKNLSDGDRTRLAEIGAGLPDDEQRSQLARVAMQLNRDQETDADTRFDQGYLDSLLGRARNGAAFGIQPQFVGNLLDRVNAIVAA